MARDNVYQDKDGNDIEIKGILASQVREWLTDHERKGNDVLSMRVENDSDEEAVEVSVVMASGHTKKWRAPRGSSKKKSDIRVDPPVDTVTGPGAATVPLGQPQTPAAKFEKAQAEKNFPASQRTGAQTNLAAAEAQLQAAEQEQDQAQAALVQETEAAEAAEKAKKKAAADAKKAEK